MHNLPANMNCSLLWSLWFYAKPIMALYNWSVKWLFWVGNANSFDNGLVCSDYIVTLCPWWLCFFKKNFCQIYRLSSDSKSRLSEIRANFFCRRQWWKWDHFSAQRTHSNCPHSQLNLQRYFKGNTTNVQTMFKKHFVTCSLSRWEHT